MRVVGRHQLLKGLDLYILLMLPQNFEIYDNDTSLALDRKIYVIYI